MQLNCSQKSIEGKLQAGNTLLMNAGARGLASVIIPMAKAFGVRWVVITVPYGTNDFSHYKTQKDLRDQVAKHLLQITKTYAGKRVFIITPNWRGQRDGNYQWGVDNRWACLHVGDLQMQNGSHESTLLWWSVAMSRPGICGKIQCQERKSWGCR